MEAVDTDLEERLTIEKDLTGLRSEQSDREKLVLLLRENKQQLFGHVNPDDINASCKPLSCLEKVALDDLLVNVRSEKSYLILRSIFIHLSSTRKVILIVEDHQGGTSVCLIYNHVFVSNMEEEFALGTVFVVKEPFLKQCKDEHQVLVVSNPTDLVKITRQHNMFQETMLLGWSDTSKDPETAQGWRNVGLYASRLGKYDVALEAYLMGLKLKPEFETRWKLHLNLVLTYFKVGFFELCLEHVSLVLEIQPRNQKSLFHAGQSHYELRQYESAKQYFETLLKINPSHPNATDEIERCKKRIKEESGIISVFDLFEIKQEEYTKYIDFGDFVGPIEIGSVAGKEPSFVAKEDIRPGTLVLAEKAVVADMVDNSGEVFDQKFTEISGLLAKTLNIIYKNPLTFGKLLDLSCTSPNKEKEHILFCNVEDNSEITIDVPRTLSILWTNFLLIRGAGEKLSLLYYYASFINHSCVPNCSLFTYNDVMLVRTSTLVKKGEEILVAYRIDLSPRLKGLSVRGSICNCAYCQLELEDSTEVKMKRTDLLTMASKRKIDIPSTVSALEETYKQRDKYTTVLFHPYLILAETQNVFRGDFEIRYMYFANKALNCLGLSTDDLLLCATDQNAYLPRDAMLTDEDLLYEAAIKIMFSYTKRSKIKQWFDVLLMLERVFTGGDLRMLSRKFPQVQMVLPLVLS